MKPWKKFVAVAMIIVMLTGVGTALVFQNEIQAVMYYLRYSSEEQDKLAQENENRMEEALANANLSKKQIDSVEQQEPVEQTIKPTASNKPNNNSNVEQKPVQQPVVEEQEKQTDTETQETIEKEEAQEFDAELAAMVGEIYALRTSFVGQLEALLDEAKAEYIALPAEERSKQKMSIASKYISIAGGLEKSCDNQMEEILGRIQTRLQETGGDVALIDEIRQVYKDEKALKKSYYMSLLD